MPRRKTLSQRNKEHDRLNIYNWRKRSPYPTFEANGQTYQGRFQYRIKGVWFRKCARAELSRLSVRRYLAYSALQPRLLLNHTPMHTTPGISLTFEKLFLIQIFQTVLGSTDDYLLHPFPATIIIQVMMKFIDVPIEVVAIPMQLLSGGLFMIILRPNVGCTSCYESNTRPSKF